MLNTKTLRYLILALMVVTVVITALLTDFLLAEAKIAVAPGTGFGHYGDGHVRFAMIENEARTRQALRGIKEMFRKDGLL
jgi:aspartate/methionine/tyrosine aminotransferase